MQGDHREVPVGRHRGWPGGAQEASVRPHDLRQEVGRVVVNPFEAAQRGKSPCRLLAIDNPFEVACVSGLDWFFGIQGNGHARANHELQGFEYANLEAQVGLPSSTQHSVFFGTPSRRFLDADRRAIARDVAASVACGRFDSALMFTEDVFDPLPDTVLRHQITAGLVLLVATSNKDIPVEAVRTLARKCRRAASRPPRRVLTAATVAAAAAAIAALALLRYSKYTK